MKFKALHDTNRSVVRVAPNKLFFITAKAWKNIYSDKPHSLGLNEIFNGITGKGLLIGSSHEDHARIRGFLSPAFRINVMSDSEGNMR